MKSKVFKCCCCSTMKHSTKCQRVLFKWSLLYVMVQLHFEIVPWLPQTVIPNAASPDLRDVIAEAWLATYHITYILYIRQVYYPSRLTVVNKLKVQPCLGKNCASCGENQFSNTDPKIISNSLCFCSKLLPKHNRCGK